MVRADDGLDTIAKVLNQEPAKYASRALKKTEERQWLAQPLRQAITRSDFLFTGKFISKVHGVEIDIGLQFFTEAEIQDARNRIKHRDKESGHSATRD